MAAGLPIVDGVVPPVGRPVGCKRCGGRGTRGRSACIEILPMTEKLREMCLARCSGQELTNQAIAEGMVTMREVAVKKALDFQISLEEIVRVFAQEE
jgi:type IV pilus assembly protein PilB